jgi:hypothetical protein
MVKRRILLGLSSEVLQEKLSAEDIAVYYLWSSDTIKASSQQPFKYWRFGKTSRENPLEEIGREASVIMGLADVTYRDQYLSWITHLIVRNDGGIDFSHLEKVMGPALIIYNADLIERVYKFQENIKKIQP